jgi:hypothetical protein
VAEHLDGEAGPATSPTRYAEIAHLEASRLISIFVVA